ncbi:MAG: helix-turn-helix domain-containing protein [Alphaproteobacteria bacterium]|nr:helix-turn-helix domain-containing protein [Alphaproteobacteria bacterium]
MLPFDDRRQSNELGQRLQALGNDAADRLARISRFVEIPADGTIIFEGDSAADIFVISSGIARIFKLLPDGRRQITRFLYAGDFLGVNFNDHYGFGAEAATAISLLAFRRRGLEQLIEEVPEIRRMFLSNAFSELAAAQDHMLLLGQKSATERVASFLLMLARRQGARAVGSAKKLPIPVSGIDVADYLGLTLETVSRTLSKLRRKGIIRAYRSRREIKILSREKLQNLSGESS